MFKKFLILVVFLGLFSVAQVSAANIEIINNETGGNVTVNYYIRQYAPQHPITKEVITLAKNGTPMVVFGNGSGKNVMIVAGVHGNELPPQLAALKLIDYLADKKINGTVYIVPFLIPSSTATSSRYWKGQNPNSIADHKGTPTNRIVQIAKERLIQALGDFHSTQPGGTPGTDAVFCSRTPTYESYKIAYYISKNSLSKLIAYEKAGLEYQGALEDVCNLEGIPSVTCEVLSPHGTVAVGSVDRSFMQMILFLKYNNIILDASLSISQVVTSANTIKNYYESYKRLPSNVTINNNYYNMGQVLYLSCKATLNINSGSTSMISVGNLKSATASYENYKRGIIYKSEYLKVARNIRGFIEVYNRAPNYASTSRGKIPFHKLVYMYTRILCFYSVNGRLPGYVTV
ncbi:MAG: succinylglutamate desuccinylase/aspartoacylase family protein [Methanobacteriales archaeon]|nr:succinylglutamate desuccinylase/aspartoacylase family protein [Methanobacteriales archaeon]